MGNDGRRLDALRWRGVLAEGSVVLRRSVAAILALACVASILTQWGYLGVLFANGSVSYLVNMLVPIALAALLLGTLDATAIGLFAGLALCLHALLIPLDYFEIAFVTPVTSVVAMAAFGLVLAVLFSLISRNGGGGRRALMIALACAAASGVFTALFAAGIVMQAQAASPMVARFALGGAAFQLLGDTAVTSVAVIACLMLVEWAGLRANLAGLRGAFAARLLGVMVAAFMVATAFAYGNVTAGKRNDSFDNMKSEADYLLNQVMLATEYDGGTSQQLAEGEGAVVGASGVPARLDAGSMARSLIVGYTEEVDGLVIVSSQGRLLAADTERLGISPGDSLDGVFGEDVLAATRRSIDDNSLEQVVYVAPIAFDNLVDLVVPGTGEEASTRVVSQVGYLVASEQDDCQVVVIRPVSMVFDGRDDVLTWITASSLGLLLAVSALVWRLLNQVARRIDATNATLERITEGDLEARVEPGGTFEFHELSVGINHTVETLQGWIAEAERRMDEELATARAIQESALPNVFPPYPDIQRFDIYASMNAAKEVGGDFYDFFLIGDDCGPASGKLGFVLADVSGKGVPAALFMMEAKTQIRDYLESGMELGEAVENANHRLCEGNDEGMFVTAWVGILDYASGHVDYVNAGHNPPLMWKDGSWRWLKQKSGLPLGLFDEMPYMAYSLDCEVGEQILIYTDGVTEAFSVDDEQYGEERLARLVQECFDLHPRELVDCVRTSVATFAEGAEQSDDITILALEIGVPPEEKAQIVVEAVVGELESVVGFIHGELDRRLCPARVQNQLRRAIEELFVNVCSYAYEGMDDAIDRRVRVTYSYRVEPRSIVVELIDDGVPFDPLANQAEGFGVDAMLGGLDFGGLGIMMAKKSVDEMSYERVGESNVVTLVKCW